MTQEELQEKIDVLLQREQQYRDMITTLKFLDVTTSDWNTEIIEKDDLDAALELAPEPYEC